MPTKKKKRWPSPDILYKSLREARERQVSSEFDKLEARVLADTGGLKTTVSMLETVQANCKKRD